jgi:hypothetical protein
VSVEGGIVVPAAQQEYPFMTERLSLPLPRGWPKQIRGAVLSAIALERLALLHVRAGFEHSDDPRARLTSELDIAREQIELLQEQVRILGARLARVPPAKRSALSAGRATCDPGAARTRALEPTSDRARVHGHCANRGSMASTARA